MATPPACPLTRFGCASETAPLRRVLLKHPRDAFGSTARLAAEWRELGYRGNPEYSLALEQYDAFATLLEDAGAEICWLPTQAGTGPDSIYARDPAVMTPSGLVLGRMGKPARQGEPEAIAAWARAAEIPILGRIEPPGLLEGGDLAWLDPRTIAIGEGYRTNAEGIRQLSDLLRGLDLVDDVIPVPLPHGKGPADCLHLMSLLSPVDRDLAVAYSPLLAVPFRRRLLDRGIHLVEVPDGEWDSMACNVLAVAPRRCLMLEGNPRTRAALEAAGADVRTYAGSEICLKGCGGPTCLTRPILRD